MLTADGLIIGSTLSRVTTRDISALLQEAKGGRYEFRR